MKIEITTTPKAVERVNALLAHCIDNLEHNQEWKDYFDCWNDKRIRELESFRKSMLKSFLGE